MKRGSFLVLSHFWTLSMEEQFYLIWPILLIVWGGVRLVEIGYWHFASKDMPQRGVTGGEWVLILVLVLIGSAVWGTERLVRDHFGPMHFGLDEMFGESHDYDVPASDIETGSFSLMSSTIGASR